MKASLVFGSTQMPDGPPSSVVSALPPVFSYWPSVQQQLAVARELHHAMPVVAADPDVVLVIDEDAVRLARPVGRSR